MSGSSPTWPPAAPDPESLPSPLPRARRGSEKQTSIRLRLTTTTPIYGGSTTPREVDTIDVIRAASIRGQLRFWWRALHAPRYARPEQLYSQESALWGGPAGGELGGRSRVEIRTVVLDRTTKRQVPAQGDLAYALFPARETKQSRNGEPSKAAELYDAGITFDLEVYFPTAHELELRETLRAWLLFGGYGGRTRRGLGSLTVAAEQDRELWLPERATTQAIARLFGRDIFAPASVSTDVPLFADAKLRLDTPVRSPEKAWETAVSWLREFRQGTDSPNPAREPGDRSRPGRSRWPEADKIRHLSALPKGTSWAHDPRHNDTPAWPRAVLGLPIIGQFQPKGRDGKRYHEQDPPKLEPENFELGWLKGGEHHDRLASPLIVKALPLADG
ncbi:MAG TPA: type III-B CRISPR module RAMP protein Cmr1, partial [Nannocystis sp.]